MKRNFLIVLCLSAFATLPWLGKVDFYTRGEPREALVAQAMLNTGNWILPTVYSGSVPSKPPFSHWLIALASLADGAVTEFSARLPAALAFILFMGAFYLFVSKRFNDSTALRGSLILFTASEWFRSSLTCRVDTVLAACMAGGLMALFAWSQRRFPGLPWIAIILLTGATLVKGPVGIVLPAGIFSLYLLLERVPLSKIIAADFQAFLPPLILASSWYGLAYMRGGEVFWNKVYYENFARFSGSMQDHPHSHSAIYLAVSFLIGFLPWTLPLLAVAYHNGRGWISTLISAFQRKDLQTSPATSFLRFCIICLVCFLVFYSIPASKRSVYLLPAYPFGAVLIASFMGTELRREHHVFINAAAFVAIFLGAFLTLSEIALGVLTHFNIEFGSNRTVALLSLAKRIWSNFILSEDILFSFFFIALALMSLTLVVGLRQRWPQHSILKVTFGVLVLACLEANSVLLPAASGALSLKPFSRQIENDVAAAPKLYSFGDEFYGISFYLNKQIVSTSGKKLRDGSLVLCYQSKVEELRKALNSEVNIEPVALSNSEVVKPGEKLGLYLVKALVIAQPQEQVNPL